MPSSSRLNHIRPDDPGKGSGADGRSLGRVGLGETGFFIFPFRPVIKKGEIENPEIQEQGQYTHAPVDKVGDALCCSANRHAAQWRKILRLLQMGKRQHKSKRMPGEAKNNNGDQQQGKGKNAERAPETSKDQQYKPTRW